MQALNLDYDRRKSFMAAMKALPSSGGARALQVALVDALKGVGVEVDPSLLDAGLPPATLLVVEPGQQADLIALYAIPSTITDEERAELTTATGAYFDPMQMDCHPVTLAAATRVLCRCGYQDPEWWQEMYDELRDMAEGDADALPTPDWVHAHRGAWRDYGFFNTMTGLTEPKYVGSAFSSLVVVRRV
jgi:hypothetical protein